MVKLTVPEPVPLPGVTLVIQLAPLVAVQAHPGIVVTAMAEPAPPAAAADWEVGLMEYEHAAACCTTEKVCPATVNVPVRGMPAGLAPTVKFTVPVPVPLPGVTLVIQVEPLPAVQAHPGIVVMAIAEPAPPAAATDWEVGLIAYEHPGACCMTEKV
jgi:hypothetical protein